MDRRFWRLIGFLLVFGSVPLWAASTKIDAWLLDSMIKVFPGTMPIKSGKTVPEWACARNGHISVQLAVRATESLENFSVEVPPLSGPGGKSIASVKVEQAGYVVVGSNSTETPQEELVGEAPGWYPDPLLPVSSSLPSRRTIPIWITIHVPADAVAGVFDDDRQDGAARSFDWRGFGGHDAQLVKPVGITS